MTCIVDDSGDYYTPRDNLKLHKCSYSRRRSPGGIETTQTTLYRNFGKKRGEGVFSRGRISRRLRYVLLS